MLSPFVSTLLKSYRHFSDLGVKITLSHRHVGKHKFSHAKNKYTVHAAIHGLVHYPEPVMQVQAHMYVPYFKITNSLTDGHVHLHGDDVVFFALKTKSKILHFNFLYIFFLPESTAAFLFHLPFQSPVACKYRYGIRVMSIFNNCWNIYM